MRALLPILGILAGCGPAEPERVPVQWSWEIDDGLFEGDPEPTWGELFTTVAADMDLDGDPDLLLQRHHVQRSELFENVDGRFVQANPRMDDRSGMYDNPGIPDLFADPETMPDAIDAHGLDGVYVWHDDNRGSVWHLDVVGPEVTLQIRVNQTLGPLSGLDPEQWSPTGEYGAIATPPSGARVTFNNELVATQLVLRRLEGDSPFQVGRTFVEDDSEELTLWKNDPHGVAWVDRLEGPEPELFVTRGGLVGRLQPPLDPKSDQLFLWRDEELLYEEAPASMVPDDYGRGRQVSWLDVDADGQEELYIACTATPNRLLDERAPGAFSDVAEAWGVDGEEPEAFAWLDVDGDDRLDLVQARDDSLEVLLHRGDHFAGEDGAARGLIPPIPPSQDASGVFNPFTLQAIDHDRDGDLDLWSTHFGEDRGVSVLRNDDGQFTDVTEELELGGAAGFSTLLVEDVDGDGWLDLYAVSPWSAVLWRNIQGTRFRPRVIDGVGFLDATTADVDGDGALDLVGVGAAFQRRVVFDRSEGGHGVRVVPVDAPLGTLVRGYYRDGSVLLQVHGGQTSRYSQVAEPLRFGKNGLEGVTVQVPGGSESPLQ